VCQQPRIYNVVTEHDTNY